MVKTKQSKKLVAKTATQEFDCLLVERNDTH